MHSNLLVGSGARQIRSREPRVCVDNIADTLIMEAQRGRVEKSALLSANTVFRITSGESAAVNTYLRQDFGLRHDSLIREQQVIQTPECVREPPDLARDGPRDGPDWWHFDCSDAAYERRHRKYELAERRDRNRELDTLRFELHKLQIRIKEGEVCKAEVLIVAEELEAKHSRYLTAHRSRPKHSKVQLESSANISQGSFRILSDSLGRPMVATTKDESESPIDRPTKRLRQGVDDSNNLNPETIQTSRVTAATNPRIVLAALRTQGIQPTFTEKRPVHAFGGDLPRFGVSLNFELPDGMVEPLDEQKSLLLQ